MADVHDAKTRSYNMSRIRSKDTKPELIVRKYLHSLGFRYRLHVRNLPGKPDIVVPKFRTVIFVHGCFWHGHQNCKYFVIPKTRTKWWESKINRNRELDKKNIALLRQDSWKVITIFECSLKGEKANKSLLKLVTRIKSNFYDKKNINNKPC
jgi:DNA mismatch endonuclease, patch repair protein